MKFFETIMSMFGKVNADAVRADQLEEAERLALEHEAAAEHHAALATMYQARVRRLCRGVVTE